MRDKHKPLDRRSRCAGMRGAGMESRERGTGDRTINHEIHSAAEPQPKESEPKGTAQQENRKQQEYRKTMKNVASSPSWISHTTTKKGCHEERAHL